ncbi:MAG TPA: DUF1501 domain-containing protein [Rhodospirillales bacterium]|jgi:uncharacterized protein (DUF1501 family)|nr:DUF1501 domain-containing protein [Rhodospirillales bacterium]
MERRRFLSLLGALPLAAAGASRAQAAALADAQAVAFGCTPDAASANVLGEWWRRTLVLVELEGGNDGLNTVVPFADAAYYRLRPKLAIKRERVIQADERLGFNAALEPLMPWWRRCQMAVVLGVGYPQPNLSHFRSVEIWETASESEEYLDSGWVAQLFAERPLREALAADGIILGRNQAGPLFGPGFRAVSLNNFADAAKQAKRMKDLVLATPNPALAHVVRVQSDLRRAAERILEKGFDTIDAGASFAATPFGRQLEIAARLLRAGVAAPVIKISIGSFDNHANQARTHQGLLEQLASGLAAFAHSMETAGLWDRVLVMTYSEFGRRAGENGSAGTDHGTAAPHLMMGGRIRGGFYGEQPPLDGLADGNLAHRVHFRRLYATVAREWWGLEAPAIAERPLGCIA